jgi:hypothetical protein
MDQSLIKISLGADRFIPDLFQHVMAREELAGVEQPGGFGESRIVNHGAAAEGRSKSQGQRAKRQAAIAEPMIARVKWNVA